LRFDLATKLTDGDGDAAMNEESLAQHGFADYTLAPRDAFRARLTAIAVDHESALQFRSNHRNQAVFSMAVVTMAAHPR